jgi:serine/threonine-protein kinase
MTDGPMKSGEVVAGKYRLDARLGVGGMGEVWRAVETASGVALALKFMHRHAAASKTARQRFAREARVSARINHPSVIDIFDVGEVDDGVLYLAMELLQGVSLADAIHAEEPLTVAEFLTVMLDTARALEAAHRVGVVHRDVKPGNIFLHLDPVTGYASAKILDFGISKLGGNEDSHHTRTGAVLGSPRYMSPEQTRSAASVDHRADLWSLGVILFEGLTGTWPHEGDSFSSLVVAICTKPPTSIDDMAPGLPAPLRALVRDLLQPLEERVQHAAEVTARLEAVLRDARFAAMVLPPPQHPPSETLKSVSGLRIRPVVLTATSSDVLPTPGSPEGLRPTAQRGGSAAPPSEAVHFADDGGEATVIRPLAPLDRASYAALDFAAPAASPLMQLSLRPGAAPLPAQLAASPAVSPAPEPVPRSLAAHPRTVPLQAAALLHAEMVRAGAIPSPAAALVHAQQLTPLPVPSPLPMEEPPRPVRPRQTTTVMAPAPPRPPPSAPAPPPSAPAPPAPPDPLVHTVSRMSFDTRPSAFPEAMAAPPLPPLLASPAPGPARPARGLSLIAAVLSLVLLGIAVALVSALRSVPPSAVVATGSAVAAGSPGVSEAPPPRGSASPAPPPPPVEPAPTASPTAAPSALATALPAATPATPPGATSAAAPEKPRLRPGKGSSRVHQLGSGL